jgi:hypothetical protein
MIETIAQAVFCDDPSGELLRLEPVTRYRRFF